MNLVSLFAGCGGMVLYTSFDLPTEGFDAIAIDFNAVENEYLVKRYYNRRLEKYFRFYDDVVITKSGTVHISGQDKGTDGTVTPVFAKALIIAYGAANLL